MAFSTVEDVVWEPYDIAHIREELLKGRETGFTDEELVTMYLVGNRGKDLYSHMKEKLERESPYKFIIINVENGDYVIGDTELESMELFEKKFGRVPSWGTQIGA
ncbi:MAG: hypothetical protein ACREGH_03070 [Minisyncoccia bacterium]